ncbi:hypothetical protein LguiB_000428 [Lonicera macranthoides]
MALLMEAGSEPKTESELADLVAINALKETAALELKEKGNEYVKMGKKHYSDAIDCYTRAINQKALSDSGTSIIYANRAHVNILLGNYKRALLDAEEAIRLSPTNIKALYRAVKASLSLNLLAEAQSYCDKGLKQNPDNEELKRLARQITLRKTEIERREAEVSKALAEAKKLVSAIEDRGLKMGRAMYQELIGLKKPLLDKDNILHWPVLLLYAEVMSSDLIEDFCETDMFSSHLDMISFYAGECPSKWVKNYIYLRRCIPLFSLASNGVILDFREKKKWLLQGFNGSNGSNGSPKNLKSLVHNNSEIKWTDVGEKKILKFVCKHSSERISKIAMFFRGRKRREINYIKIKEGLGTPKQPS